MVSRIPNTRARGLVDNQVAALNAGAAAAYIVIYTGSQPALGDAPATGTILVTITLNDPSHAAATDTDPGASAALSVLPAAPFQAAVATGTAGWFRAFDSDNNPVQDGACGITGSGAELELDNPSIVATFDVTLTGYDIQMAEAA